MSKDRSIIDILKSQIKKNNALPVLSKNSLQLQNEVVKENPNLKKIETMIKFDPSIAGHVLKMANSAFYRGLEQISTIKEAMLRLGTMELGNVVVQAVHKANFQSKDPFIRKHQKRLLSHSISCAVGSFWTAKYLDLDEILSKSFLAGLLHDMGILYLLTAFEQMKKNNVIKNYPSNVLIEQIIDKLHAEQGFELLSHWNLPEIFCKIARDHHIEDFDQTDILLTLVRCVDKVCLKMEKGNKEDDTALVAASIEVDILGISEIGLAEMEIAIEDYQQKFRLF